MSNNTLTQPKPQAETRIRKVKKTALFALAGVAAMGLVGTSVLEGVTPAKAETKVTVLGAPSFADLVDKVKPAVVSIHVKNGKADSPFKTLPKDNPLHEFFKRFGGPRRGAPLPSLAQGSGFIISEDGLVVTNNHVVEKGEEITVSFDSGEKLKAKLIGSDPRTDLALLKIQSKGKKFPTVKFATKPARVGDWVMAIGNPFGLGGTVTAGIVSAKNRNIGSGPYDYLQIDAAVNRGNSGGPTFNLKGEVVGVNTAIFSPSGGNVGIAFAVPAELTKLVVDQLKEKGTVSRGWLGVTIQTVNEELAEGLGLKKAQGAIITNITKGGPAANSDIKSGDVIIRVNDHEIKDSRDLARKIASLSPKKDALITVFRDGKEKKVTVKLGQFPNSQKLARLQRGDDFGESYDDLGMQLAPVSRRAGTDGEGVEIVDVDPNSVAAQKGLKRRDVILRVGRKTVQEPEDVIDAIRDAKKSGQRSILFYIKSGDFRSFIALPLKKDG